jgi:hypothetical protein
MDRLENVNLKINSNKCVWFTDSVKLLGHVVSAKGVEPDPSKVDSIQNSKKPENVKQLQSYVQQWQ